MKRYIQESMNVKTNTTWNVEWNHPETGYGYENFLTPMLIGEFVQNLLDDGCVDIHIRMIANS